MNVCPGCGLKSEVECKFLQNELSFYTLSLRDRWFIHQLVVDTYAAQHALPTQKAIATSFALIGLYLVYEKHFSGRQVQRAHMVAARKSKQWPKFVLPTTTWPLTVEDVVAVPEGDERDAKIREWGQTVWQIWKDKYLAQVAKLVATFLV